MVMGKRYRVAREHETHRPLLRVLRIEIETFKKFHRCVSTCLDLGGLPLDQQRVSKLMGAIVSLLHSSTHMVEHPVVSERLQ